MREHLVVDSENVLNPDSLCAFNTGRTYF